MGKGRRHKPKKNFAEKRREKQKNKDVWDKMPQRCYADIIRDNKDFENYYKSQKIVPEPEWDSFMATMKENLPVAFRITGSKAETKALLEIIKGDFFEEILNTKLEDGQEAAKEEEKMKPKCLPFYPDELAWQLQLTRKDIRRSEAYFRLHNFLIAETSSGSISRQEVVSMIPPLVLDVKPHHKVLDMCAAPGSKTAQLIEMIHADEGDTHPEGFVIANDLDNNRCYMLVHQAKRLSSPNILITNHDSSVMPNFTVTNPDGSKGILKFDRILADVPCSGDGTMRKNPDIWCKWSPANGNNLHGIQYRIVKRGLELLAVGGRLVYSTCSLNPIENEAVLHRLLVETGDSVQLVDGRNLVPGLNCDPGVTHWLPASKNLQYYNSWEEVPEQWQTQVRPQMFPPKPEDAHKFHLERSMRILPHHQDTGGFFVAVLEKVSALPWENQESINKSADKQIIQENANELSLEEEVERETKTPDDKKRPLDEEEKKPWGPQRKRKRMVGYREDPFVFFKDENEDVWPSIKEFYAISEKMDPRCLLVRCQEGKKKNIYFTSPAIRDIVLSNEIKVKMINTGVKTFVRCDNKNMKCAFRLAQEGMRSIFNYVGDCRKVHITKDDLIMLLQNDYPHTPPEIVKLSPETQERVKDFATGSCMLLYKEDKSDNPLNLEMVGWRGTMSLRAYVPIHDAVHYLRLLGADCSKFEKNKFKENRDAVAMKVDNTEENILNEEKLVGNGIEIKGGADHEENTMKPEITKETT
ncbi:tRNA (cytosine(34)-C(5))-methyltransferase [Cephus cinctus]|uniref:tRNA (cytosine(34)-C(5))-methyltransferase n=1 Tax=Cephus cinctus TaxID=211228 RepID=A0AAJ7BQ40_CEPCN|nr:tRNA (cytosine(34)-C(5))-methyltransferase [Cephus cinctus]XP_015591569.1 tRNA (cytosine(34)-C(5))-methyltransferase [Cephus cinctus]XP_015591572.1 tRNA (cytosine(34)-C(5))-methyltransferase [Cephus cinctus]XP_024939051.1 tRNA (cytosine(34)-C(5))-methyltransferase [Cephus cinctus]XP_024939052.1 tRNA (cytosine(34)-C(5))-methyltransferase [Cephus cinctus]